MTDKERRVAREGLRGRRGIYYKTDWANRMRYTYRVM